MSMKAVLGAAIAFVAVFVFFLAPLSADWPGFRGPSGAGVGDGKDIPAEWNKDNFLWKIKLPGAGASSPIVVGDKVFVTCYANYGAKLTKGMKGGFGGFGKGGKKGEDQGGDQKELRFVVACFDVKKGDLAWKKEIEPKLPEVVFSGMIREHGYASSTPVTDGQNIYVFFGKSGVLAFDLKGNQLWHKSVGTSTDNWGSGSSLALANKTLIVNASMESGALVGLDKKTGEEVWRKKGVGRTWASPAVVNLEGGKQEVVFSAPGKIMGLDPDKGTELWTCQGIGAGGGGGGKGGKGGFGGGFGGGGNYTCSTPAVKGDVVYVMGGGNPGVAPTLIAVKAGGKGDVTSTHVLWKEKAGAAICSPVVDNGLIFWVNGAITCRSADKGEKMFQESLYEGRNEYTSAVAADGKIFALTRFDGLYVLAAGKEFKQLAHNSFEGDSSIFNSTPAISGGRLYIRSNEYLYCVGKK
jgi:outer membrane protein assembly factor BamB